MTSSNKEKLYKFALSCKERWRIVGGVTHDSERDYCAMDYFNGAAKICELNGDDAMCNILNKHIMLMSVRGWGVVEDIIAKYKAEYKPE